MSSFEQIKQDLEAWCNPEGVSTSVLLQLNEPLGSTLRHVVRQGSMTFEELAQELKLDVEETEIIVNLLVACGFLKISMGESDGTRIYHLRHSKSHRSKAPVAIWRKIINGLSEDDQGGNG